MKLSQFLLVLVVLTSCASFAPKASDMPTPDHNYSNCLVLRICLNNGNFDSLNFSGENGTKYSAYFLGNDYYCLFNIPPGEYMLRNATRTTKSYNPQDPQNSRIENFTYNFDENMNDGLVYRIEKNEFRFAGKTIWKTLVPSFKDFAVTALSSMLSDEDDLVYSVKFVSKKTDHDTLADGYNFLLMFFNKTEWKSIIEKSSNLNSNNGS